MKKILTLTALGTILVASNAMAAGFHLREQSAAAQGNAFAGATAGAENASYAYYNVAGLTRHKGTQINMGATYIAPRAEAQNVRGYNADGTSYRDADVNNIVHAAWVPNGTMSYQVDDKLTLGLGLNVPYGMITKYDAEWAGSDHGITSKLMSTTVTPMAAYKLTDKLSVGAGLQMQYINARLTGTAGRGAFDTALEGEALDLGYQFGAMYEFNEKTRIGINYRSEINHKLKGDINSDKAKAAAMLAPGIYGSYAALLNQDISARLDTPEMISVGAYHQLNDKWALMAEYQRVNWSSFKNLDIVGVDTKSLISRTRENWQDTNFYAIGANYQIDDQWKLRLGIAKDQAAAKKAQRTPRIPDSDRTWYSAGLNYKYNEKLTFDFAYTYIQAKDAPMDTALTGNTDGRRVTADYKNSVKLFGLSLNYKF